MSIDSGTKKRLLLGLIAQWGSRLGNTLIQLVQVPFFLHFWAPALYGEWMIVTALPTYLGFSNIGFGSVAGSEMTMLTARDDREGALRVFESCWWLIVIVMTVTGAVGALALYFIPVSDKLRLHEISGTDSKWILGYLGASVLLGQLEQLLQSAYRCVGKYAFGTAVKSSITLAAFASMLIPVGLREGPRVTALVYACANIAGTILLCILVRRDIPWIRFGWRHASFQEIARLSRPAFAFMGFPIGNALNLQGTLMAVGYALGPTDVVVFGTARTVSRLALQMVQMVNATFDPEFSKAFGQQHIELIRSLHRRACQAALAISTAIVLGMTLLGPWFLHRWTGGHVPPSRGLLTILLLVVVVYSLWGTSSTVLTSINRHQRLAGVYLAATAVTVGLTYVAAVHAGLYGAAASLLVSECIMSLYVLPNSLRIVDDTLPAFLASLLEVPPAFHPRAILRRLSRSDPAGPTLES